MHRILFITLILLLLLNGTYLVRAQNPFVSKDRPNQITQTTPSLPYPFLSKIAHWQQQLNQKVAFLARQAKETHSLKPLLSLIGIAFLYGVLHAAGPGHGKAVAVSYLITAGRKLKAGIFLGNLIAFCHGLSGVGIVLAIHFVIRSGIMGPVESATHTTQIISYSLIALLGGGMLVRSIFLRRNRAGTNEKRIYPLITALSIGMIPCPGVVFVMLFCLSISMIGVGLLLAFCQILGMAVTISTLGVLVLIGKNLTLQALDRHNKISRIVQQIIQSTAACFMLAFGLLFLAAIL